MAVSVSAVVLPAGLAGAAPGGTLGEGGPPVATGPRMSADRDGDHVSDDLEAKLRAAAPGDRLAVIVTGFGSMTARAAVGDFRLSHELGIINGFAATMTAAQVRGLLHVPGLRRVEEDGVVTALDETTNADFGVTAARSDHPGLDGSGVGICVIDTGIDARHEQIAPTTGEPSRVAGFADFVVSPERLDATPYDDHGHGTHVASIAAGDGRAADGSTGGDVGTFLGVAPAATLYGAKVLDSQGSGATSDVVAGIEWCHSQPGVEVISMSLGGGGGDGTDASSLAVDRASTDPADPDAVVVAAGNSGDWPQSVNAPGVAKQAITVGAVADYSAAPGTARHDAGIYLAGFSSRGPVSDGRQKPDIVAPGVKVTAAEAGTVSGYVTWSGTSMATPYVSGAVALALEAAPGTSPGALKSALTASAFDAGRSGPDNDWGAGVVDVRAFVDTVLGAASPRKTGLPAWERRSGTVADGQSVTVPISVTDAGVPLAVTMTIGGNAVCDLWCQLLGGEWSPDLDMDLRDSTGAVLAVSECALAGLYCGGGRQETIGMTLPVGDYTLRVYDFTAGDGQGGAFDLDIFRGPVAGTVPPEEPVNVAPVAQVTSDDIRVTASKKTKQGRFTLDGSPSYDPDAAPGESLTYSWTETDADGVAVGDPWSTATVPLSRDVGTYSFELVVTDVDRASDGPVHVTVTVSAPTGGGKPRRG